MKRISLSIAALMMTATLYAEADFNTVQAMIGKGEYQTALNALQIIEKNHPGMAKVQYTIAQAQAGIGNLPAAKVALAKAQAIDPKLAFVPESQVKELTAIINEVRVIKKVEQSSHWFLYTVLALGVVGTVAYFLTRRKETSVSETKSEVKTENTSYSGNFNGYKSENVNSYTSSGTPNYNSQSMNRQYRNEPVREVEVHHYHDNSSSNVGTAIAAGAVAGVATSVLTNAMLNESHHNHDSHEYNNPHRDYFSNSNYASSRNDSDSLSSLNSANSANRRETEEVSNTWNDNSSSSGISDTWKDDSSSSSISNSWEDEESTRSSSWGSSSWGSSSSDDSSSYSSSSDDSSSSSWE